MTVTAAISTGILFFFGTGLHPIWPLTWLAPLPVLILAPHISATRAAGLAFAGYLLGTINTGHYYLEILEIPPPLALGIFVITSAIFTAATLAFRRLALLGRPLTAVVTFGSVIAACEYIVANVLPGGANWSLAPTQAELIAVLQLASLGGIWLVSFVVCALPAALAAVLTTPAISTTARLRVAVASGCLLMLVGCYGLVRLGQEPEGQPIQITLLAARMPADEPILDVREGPGQQLLQGDLAALASVPAGTDVVVLPEKDLLIDETTAPTVTAQFARAAQKLGMTLIVGTETHSKQGNFNEAHIFYPDGSREVYQKQHMLPGVEDSLIAGTKNVFIRGYAHSVGLAICADMGHPDLGRSYAVDGAGVMLVPALDFTDDALSQSRVQYLRGVESGYSVVRAARLGYLTVADDRGRVVARADARNNKPFTMVTATVHNHPTGTLYRRWGDWFAWVAMALAAWGLTRGLPSAPAAGRWR